MKRSLLFILLLFFALPILAQTPQAFNWQFFVRDNTGVPLADKSVGVRLSIHSETAAGPVVYSESFSSASDELGLVSLQAGRGTVISGDFATIDWGVNPHFMQVEVDFSGGTSYEHLGTTQLYSVPYALNAASVGATTIPLGTYGGILLPQDISTCDAGSEGTVMYNTVTKKVQYCDGASWKNVDGTQYYHGH
jgi:hypothetical protein